MDTVTLHSPPPITGYRALTQDEVDLMNKVKELAARCGDLVHELRTYTVVESPDPLLDQRWVSIGATDLQKGFMALVRSIAQPTTF